VRNGIAEATCRAFLWQATTPAGDDVRAVRGGGLAPQSEQGAGQSDRTESSDRATAGETRRSQAFAELIEADGIHD
jgi:hypothetical protein